MHKLIVIEAAFYKDIADQLWEGVSDILDAHGETTFDRITVPGCFEIPAALSMAIASKKYSGAITLGCVIRGETTHYDYVCQESAKGINELATNHQFPVGYGIITAENKAQAEARANKSKKNVGGRAAQACLTMINLKQQLT